jgi:hypothetical protein
MPRGGPSWRWRGGTKWRRRSGFADALDQACGIQERGRLVDRLLDVECDLNRLGDIAGFRAGLGCLRQTGGFVKPLMDPLDEGLDGNFGRLGVHVQRSLGAPCALI